MPGRLPGLSYKLSSFGLGKGLEHCSRVGNCKSPPAAERNNFDSYNLKLVHPVTLCASEKVDCVYKHCFIESSCRETSGARLAHLLKALPAVQNEGCLGRGAKSPQKLIGLCATQHTCQCRLVSPHSLVMQLLDVTRLKVPHPEDRLHHDCS